MRICVKLTVYAVFCILVLGGCVEQPLFSLRMGSGISFNNHIDETDSINILKNQYLYNGGGVAIADFNGDGLEDIYFTGNLVSNALYINTGNLQFDDVTTSSNSDCAGYWCSGASIVDINNDGKVDIYISVTSIQLGEKKKNILLVNQGNDTAGNPVFHNQAAEYGLDLDTYSVHSVFFDYDHDGLLDVYVINDFLTGEFVNMIQMKDKYDIDSNNLNLLLRNVNGKYFEDVTKSSGLIDDGYSLGVSVADVNEDGWHDIFVSNDYSSSSSLFINQGNGTFKEDFLSYAKHQSFSSMGVDFADFNNDGREDFVTLDMLPQKLARIKQMFSKSHYMLLDLLKLHGYAPQYMRNCLYTQNEKGTFSEISQLAGVQNTDWSWAAMFVDFDNDGWKDLYVTNGFPRDLTDLDFIYFRNRYNSILSSTKDLLDHIPIVKISNKMFRNTKSYRFEDVTASWGLELPTFSNGFATADLDRDGDMDIVINNINNEATLYENSSDGEHSYIQLVLNGSNTNRLGLHTKVIAYSGSHKQYAKVNPYRGYISSNSLVQHFAIPDAENFDSIQIFWNKQEVTVLTHIKVNQRITIDYNTCAKIKRLEEKHQKYQPLLGEEAQAYQLQFVHIENQNKDFYSFGLHQKVYTNEGPPVALGDINGDGLQDVVIGQGVGAKTALLIQRPNRTFSKHELQLDDTVKEVTALSLFDRDGDGDLDLYIGYGHASFKDKWLLRDKLFINNGNGLFVEQDDSLPIMEEATSKVLPFDIDGDGDEDLLVFSRVRIYDYPTIPRSFCLINEDGKLKDKTNQYFKDSGLLGMITDADVVDINGDGVSEILICGEWMPLRVLVFKGNRFVDETDTYFAHPLAGWWNKIEVADLDGDGDLDVIAGNYGYNHPYDISEEHPLKMVFGEFARKGETEAMVFAFEDDDYYPIHLRGDVMIQLPNKKKRFLLYEQYAHASLNTFFTKEEMKEANTLLLHTTSSVVFENKNAVYISHELPIEAQFAPIFGLYADDLNRKDNKTDILIVGNDPAAQPFTGPENASYGAIVQVDTAFNFSVMPMQKSGFYVDGFAKGIYKVEIGSDTSLYLVPMNEGLMKVFQVR